MVVLECVTNISEGRDRSVIDAVVAAAGDAVLDVHLDGDHHRSVLTLLGADAARAVATAAVERIDLRSHQGVHPRIGAVDVVPFVPLAGSTMDDAVAARNEFAAWAAETLALPSFFYGPERTLPEIRRTAFASLTPDVGPAEPHPTAGAVAVGARPLLVAYNVWLTRPDLAEARRIAALLRRPGLRTLGLAVGPRVQVSMNLTDPLVLGPADATDLVAAETEVDQCELVGLVPRATLDATPRHRWAALDLDLDRTIEARIEQISPTIR